MSIFARALAAAILFVPIAASADLIQEITAFERDDNGNPVGDPIQFGTLIFPNEAQLPFEFPGDNPTCAFPNTFNDPNKPPEAEGLPLCEAGEFIGNRDGFEPFNDLDGNGLALPDTLPLFGAWFLDDEWQVEAIFAYTAFGFGNGDILTLVFGNFGGLCGTIQTYVAVNCFDPNLQEKEVWSYQLDPAHSVPEPGTLALLGLGLGAIALRSRRRKL